MVFEYTYKSSRTWGMDDMSVPKLYPANPERWDELTDREKGIWQAGHDWGYRDSDSEHTFDRFQEAEELLECLNLLYPKMLGQDRYQAEMEAFKTLKAFFEKRIEDNS